ncbi:MAG: hypothetical protein Q8P46_00250 [Hyphomicrobiales bacterium]|nr:hypothetical protein [Hyphomicrobiales bacterium]
MFSVKNFERFQHYKDRAPPWIKLYNELLDDYEFSRLPDASKWHLIAIWLLASRSDNKIPFDPTWVARRINADSEVNLDALREAGFIVVDQTLQSMEQDASDVQAKRLSRERGEGEGEGERKNAEPNGSGAVSAPLDPEKDLFDRGKAVLGKSAGGQIVKLLKAKGGSIPLARAAIEMAATKQNAGEYIGAIIRGALPDDPAEARMKVGL